MSNPPDTVSRLSATLTLCEYQSPKNGSFGFWLYDKTRGMNLSMKAESKEAAFIEAITYYQNRVTMVEEQFRKINTYVDDFVTLVRPEESDWDE